MERLVVRLVGDSTKYQGMVQGAIKSTDAMGKQLSKTTDDTKAFGQTIDNLGTTMGKFAGTMMAFAAIGSPMAFLKGSIGKYAEAEQMQMAFTTMLGSAEKAQETIGDLKKFAAETPFEMPEIVAASRQMLAFGGNARDIVPTMTMLGDVASGLNIPLGELTYIFGTLKSQGRAFTQDINQFAMRGIPIWDSLADVMGVTQSEIRGLVETGRIGFPEVERAFTRMTSAGGKFAGGMKGQSTTFNGLWSTMNDAFGQFQERVGKAAMETLYLKEALVLLTGAGEGLTKWMESFGATGRTMVSVTALAAGGFGTLLITWKVLNLAIGMVVGNLAHMWNSLKWGIQALRALNAATVAHTVVTQQATAFQAAQTVVIEANTKAVLIMRGAYAALALVVAYAVVRGAMAAEGSLSRLHDELERGKKINDEWLAAVGTKFSKELDRIALIENEADKTKTLNRVVNEQTELMKKRREEAEKAKRLYEIGGPNFEKSDAASRRNMGDTWADTMNWVGRQVRSPYGVDAGLLGEMKEAEEIAAAAEKNYKQALAARNSFEENVAGVKLVDDADALIKKLQQQRKEMGLSAEQVEAMRLEERNLSADKLSQVHAEIAYTEEAKRQNEERKKSLDLINNLQEAVKTLGLTEYELFQNQLKDAGVTGGDAEYATRMHDKIEAFKYQQDAMKRGQSVTDQFLTQQQKLARTNAELSELLIAGAISAETYDKAMAKAAESTERLANATRDFSDANSLEGLAKIRDYQDMIYNWGVKGGPTSRSVEAAPMPREVNRADDEAKGFWRRIAEATERSAAATEFSGDATEGIFGGTFS